jgi:hypothetical protein
VTTADDINVIQQWMKLLFHVPFKTIVPPVFVQEVAVFYIVDEFDAGWLYFYVWNSNSNFFELDTRVNVVTTVTTDWENETSLIRSIEGGIFKENGVTGIKHFMTSDLSWTESTLTFDYSSFTSYTGTVDESILILRQRRDDWLTYDSTETAEPTIIGWMNDDYVFVMTYQTTTLQVDNSIAMPCNTDQITAGCPDADRAFIVLKPEWIDIGTNYMAILSPIDCAAVY